MLPFVSIEVAQQLWPQGKAFRVKLRYQGFTSDKGNRSDKWWLLAYEGNANGTLKCNHGKTGSSGRKVAYEWTFQKCIKTCRDKLAKGYRYIPATAHSMPKAPKPQPRPRIVLEGVFAEIRKIVEVTRDHFECFDAGGLFLLDLTETGALQVASADTFRIQLERL